MKSFAFVFPGQGSQSVGMLDAWGEHPEVVKTLREASAALGEDVAKLIHEGPKETLALTTNTQPVMLVAGVAAYRVCMAWARRRTKGTAWDKVSTPAATSAEYSPSEWQATATGATPVSAIQAR